MRKSLNEQREEWVKHGLNHPWMFEPDELRFQHLGYLCYLRRNPDVLNWCGYVAVKKNHPFFGYDYDALNEDVEVHGGLTFADFMEGDEFYWFGFDCAHAWDELPCFEFYKKTVPDWPLPIEKYGRLDQYRDVGFVTEECKKLAEQLKCLQKKRHRIYLKRMFLFLKFRLSLLNPMRLICLKKKSKNFR